MTTKSGKHANKIVENALSSAAKNGAAKAVDMRKVAALSAGAAGVIAGAAIAFGATPAMAAEATSTPVKTTEPAKEQELTANKKKAEAKDEAAAEGAKKTETDASKKDEASEKTDGEAKANENKTKLAGEGAAKADANAAEVVDQQAESGKAPAGSTTSDAESGASADASEQGAANENSGAAKRRGRRSLPSAQPTNEAAGGEDRDATNQQPNPGSQANSTIELSEKTKDTLPNMYAWGSSDNVYIEKGQNQEVKFILKPADGVSVTKVAIFPSDTNGIESTSSRVFLEYYSDDTNAHQSYSGTYDFKANNDGSATLTMSKLYREGRINGAQGYAANRCIYVYGTKDGKTVLLYKTNVARAATLIPPKNAGSIVLKYNEELTEKQIQDKLKAALGAPTEATGKKSVSQQIVAASTASKVGARTGANGAFVQTPDNPEKKIVITDNKAYDTKQVETINTVTSAPGDAVTSYKTGAQTLDTHLISDLGYKSDVLPLTVARYDTRIDKPVVKDSNSISDDVKKEIAKKLANLNHIPQDKVTINTDGTVTINFEGVDPSLAPKIKLSDLVLKQLEEADVNVPTGDKAVFVYNPLGYSKAEIKSIKKAIYDANKGNDKLGLTEADYEKQITLEYITGDTTVGHINTGISNGMAENMITVKIKTDKAVAEFTSDVKKSKLTKLVNIRKDYTVSWDESNNKIAGRTFDEGLSWSDDHKTIIYRYDPTKATAFNSDDVTKLLTATPTNPNAGLRTIKGNETLQYEGSGNNPRKSHMHYALQNGEPTGALTLGVISSGYWKGNVKITGTDVDMGDVLAKTGSYSWDEDANAVNVASKDGKIYRARLFVAPYGMEYYQHLYAFPDGKNQNNTPKAINIIFVPQTNHKTSDLKKSVDGHQLAADKKTPTDSAYYNASDKVKKDYEDALNTAKTLYEQVKDTDESKLTEQQKADIDNATIKLEKARKALDGAKTNKDGLNTSIDANGNAAEGQQAATGTQATNQFKNVSDPDFKTPDGKPDTDKNNKAAAAKTAYDEALAEANKVKEDENATQKAVDDAKAKLDEARKKLNDFTTNKDELNNTIAQNGHVNTGDPKKADPTEKLKTADPTYQNSKKEEREAYDKAVTEANKVAADPNASQKEVNEAIKKLKEAKAALDKNATDKAPLDAAVQKSLDNDSTKHSVFYTNAKNKTNDPAAKKAVEDYDKALAEAKRVLDDKNATKADVEKAKKDLEDAEKVLYADTYQTKTTDLAQALVDNFGGYLMPAYFNAFDLSQSKDPADAAKAEQAAKDFKAYNDAYHAAKDLMEKTKKQGSTVKQDEVDKVKKQLVEARKAIDKYATDTSKISAALLHSLAITNSPAYKNASANTDPNSEEAKAAKAYDDALKALQNAFNDKMPQDTVDGKPDSDPISTNNIPVKNGDTSSPDYLKNIQSHAKGQPLNRDVTKLLAKLNDAVKGLDKFKTKTDDLIKSINEDDNTKQTPAYKNSSVRVFQKADSSDADADKNAKAKQAVDKYGEMLNAAKDLLKDPTATQAQINEAKKNLDDARKTLLGDPKDQANTPGFNTDTTKLKASAEKHGKEKQGETPATEGTVTSDAYRNASDPHFLTADGQPDDNRNNAAKKAKADYDKALAKAQELLNKADPKSKTPLDAQPTQQEVNDALKTLDDARTEIEKYKTDTNKLDAEAKKSTADGGTLADTDFEAMPEFKNADAKKGDKGAENPDVTAYKEALKKARELVKAATDTTLSKRPTQQQVDEALDALKKAKQTITDTYKTNASLLKDAKEFASVGFKDTPEYKNAVVIKNDNSDTQKQSKAKAAVDALDKDTNNGALKKAIDILNKFDDDGKPKAGETNIPTQAQVDEALDTLQKAMKTVTDNFKTDVKPLQNEVGDKDEHGNDVTPPFEATVEYKNVLAKVDAGDNDATTKLNAYNEKLKAAQELINKVKNPDPNADSSKQPTNADVKQALDDLQAAKKAITDGFKTNASDLKNEADDKDEHGTAHTPAFESSTEYLNALAKKTGEEDIPDVKAYKDALQKAQDLLKKFNDDGSAPKQGEKDIPTQKEVDDALQTLKDIKEKILANYKTNPTELNEEVKNSKDGDDDKRDDVFENTPAFKNAAAVKGENGADNDDIKAYKDALDKARNLLSAFDLTTGKVKDQLPSGMNQAPTKKELDDALKTLQEAKKKIEDKYSTQKGALSNEAGADDTFRKTPEFQNAVGSPEAEEYEKALAEAKSVLGDKDATQAQVDAALKRLQDAKAALRGKHGTDKSDLRNEAENDPTFRDSIPFLIANSEDIAEYNKALNEANAVLKDPNATQAQVDAALRKLQLAKQKIMDFYNSLGSFGNGGSGYVGTGFGVGAAAVDKSMLIVEVNGALADIANGVNANASANAANAAAVISEFNAALQNARAVLANPNATQAQVDAALNRLRAARAALAALNAADADRGGSSRGSLSVQTGVDSATLSAFAAMFVGLAGLGVSAKRRKHASK